MENRRIRVFTGEAAFEISLDALMKEQGYEGEVDIQELVIYYHGKEKDDRWVKILDEQPKTKAVNKTDG